MSKFKNVSKFINFKIFYIQKLKSKNKMSKKNVNNDSENMEEEDGDMNSDRKDAVP